MTPRDEGGGAVQECVLQTCPAAHWRTFPTLADLRHAAGRYRKTLSVRV